MKRPNLSLLVILLSGVLFSGCFKNDLRALYEFWVNSVSLDYIDTTSFKEDIEDLENNKTLRTLYIAANEDATIKFNLNNNKKYIIKPELTDDSASELKDALMPKEGQELKGVLEPKVPTANKTEITLKLSQQFLLEKEGNTFNGTIKIGAYDNINSTGPDRYFDGHEINFKIIVNTPPEYRKLIFI